MLHTTYVYRLGRADWLAYESRSVSLVGWRFVATLLCPIAVGGLYGFARESELAWLPFATDDWVDKLIFAAVVFVAWFLGTTAFLTVSAHRRALRRPLFAADTTLHVSAGGLTEITGERVQVFTWDMIGDVAVASHHLFFHPVGAPPIIVPERAFERHADMTSVGHLAQARCREADTDTAV